MRIATCLKMTLDADLVEFDVASGRLVNTLTGPVPPDAHVLEEGLRLRERFGGEVVAVTAAEKDGDAILEAALRGGADRAVRVDARCGEGTDTWVISGVLARALQTLSCDLVLCGARSRDTAGALMAAALGGRLELPFATAVIGIETERGNERSIVINQKRENGRRAAYVLPLPAVLGLEEGINEPRYVAPFSRVYREGLMRSVEMLTGDVDAPSETPLLTLLAVTQPHPRVKAGAKVSGLSLQQKMKLMRGETGKKKEIVEGEPAKGAERILAEVRPFLKL
jgi:electron transfer flavoprotein beta subunit